MLRKSGCKRNINDKMEVIEMVPRKNKISKKAIIHLRHDLAMSLCMIY
jgi:hypothetical protein